MKVKFDRQDKLTWYACGHVHVGIVTDIAVHDGEVVYQMKCRGLYYDVEQKYLRECTGANTATSAELLAELKHRNFDKVRDMNVMQRLLTEDERSCLMRALDKLDCPICLEVTGRECDVGSQLCNAVEDKLRKVGIL
jgi:hypothetical protein